MKTTLLPTQVEDVDRIVYGEDIPNFSLPGTGKTLTTIGAIDRLRLNTGVVVCPTVATSMWVETLEGELGASVQLLKTRSTVIDKKADFWVMSYGVVAEQSPALFGRPAGVLVVDESHYVKGSDAARTQAVFGQDCSGTGGLYEDSAQCWCLSGTPIERYSDDLWSQLRATQPEVLDRYGAITLAGFQRQFCRMEYKSYGADKQITKYVSVGNQSEKLLNRMLYTEIGAIRRTMAEVDPYMPEVKFRTIFTPAKITPELRGIIKGKTEHQIMDMILTGGDEITRARRLMGMAKLKGTLDYIKDQAKDHPVLVGFWHTEVGTEIYKHLSKAGFAANLIYGATSATARNRIKQRFIDGEIDILVGQMQAMGVAMDGLQHASSHVIMAEDDWSAAKVEQFYKRLARKGQREHVQVDFCNSMEAVDTALVKIRQRKEMGSRLVHGS
jgi:SWI/SNF-related matrix-associated actin-dependent regulator of chromatin subfamily A-like protein 1